MKLCFQLKCLDLVFGSKPKQAFDLIDQNLTRDEIQKQTQQIVAVQQASFNVFQGEILVIMGLSGSGKSSLLRCFNGINGRGAGTCRGELQFIDPLKNTPLNLFHCSKDDLLQFRRYQAAMVFQQFGLMPWLTIAENIAYPLVLQEVPKNEQIEIVSEKLNLVGLTAWKDHYPDQLSGGMQQRVGLARAFASRAKVLLMDEPFSALDPIHRRTLQDEILRLQQQLKFTIIFVTHDLDEATRLGTRIAMMHAGRVLQIGSAQEIISNPACNEVKEFTQYKASLESPISA